MVSCVNLVDLDEDGRFDLLLATWRGRPTALLGGGKGHLTLFAGSYPQTEIHLAHDINEDGKLIRNDVSGRRREVVDQ